MAKWNHAVRGSAPDIPAFAATWLEGKAGVNALASPEPQAICAESPRQSAFAAYARPKEALQKYPEQSFAQKFGLCNR